MIDTPLFEAGIDYFTVTGKGGQPTRQLAAFGAELLSDERKAGNEYRGWGMAGFNGFKAGCVQLGERGKEVILRVSGVGAMAAFREAMTHADSISRLDTQFTVRTAKDAPTVIRRCYRSAKRLRDRRHTRGCVSILQSTDSSSTIYLNRRSSEVFGRIYDKGRESKLDHYWNAVRFETEFKGKMARRMAQELLQETDLELGSYQITRRVLAARSALANVCIDALPRSRASFFLLKARTSRTISAPASLCTRRSHWLRSAVRPTVDLFRKHGRLDEIYDALGLQQPTLRSSETQEIIALDAERIH